MKQIQSALIGVLLLTCAFVAYDYWSTIPESTTASYVGRNSCVECHAEQASAFSGSDHDLAMDLATPETVRADFSGVSVEHFGVVTSFRRDEERFFVNTEGHDGQLRDFEVKYVFGHDPLQQYMVEIEPALGEGVGKVQVLRWSWDTERNEWFYLAPPDVSERLLVDDPLHWTGYGQNWNHMCAECHSTNLQKNFDVDSRQYNTCFSEIDVSCESCHGPGSTHVELASARSLFWDRKAGMGLEANLKKDHVAQIESCAPCHSRRVRVSDQWHSGDDLADHFALQLFSPDTYYPDGQILDEVYVHGSFVQSKMYEKGIKCSDCHDVHSGKVKHQDNQLCTSCHQHPASKYDSPAHHQHEIGSTGASCIECHMPSTPYMAIDYRRDHKMSVPRPDLSAEFGTPNACTGCHLEQSGITEDRRQELGHYSKWVAAARDGDETIEKALRRVDEWARDKAIEWYGDKDRDRIAIEAFSLAWDGDPKAREKVYIIADDRKRSAIQRASAVALLPNYASEEARQIAERCLRDRSPLVRAAAATYFSNSDAATQKKVLVPLLEDPRRQVRIAAAQVLARLPRKLLGRDASAMDSVLDQRDAALRVDSDLAGSHIMMAVQAEGQQDWNRAIKHYLQAIHVQPQVTGPRTNLASIYERLGRMTDAKRLRLEELPLLERDAKLVPEEASIQYRLGLFYYTLGRVDDCEAPIRRAWKLEPRREEYALFLALLYEKQERWEDAQRMANLLVNLDDKNAMYLELKAKFDSAAE